MRQVLVVVMLAAVTGGLSSPKAFCAGHPLIPFEEVAQSPAPDGPAAVSATSPAQIPGNADASAVANGMEVPVDALATVLGQVVRDRDCKSRRLGVGSVEVGLHLLIHKILVEDLCRSKNVQLSAEEIRSYTETVRQVAARSKTNVPKPGGEPEFQEVTFRFRMEQIHKSVSTPSVPLLERLALQDDERALQHALELRSEMAVNAWRDLWPLRTEETLYKAYGGKIVARQLGFQAAGAFQKLVEEAREDGRLRFHDPLLERAFEERVQTDLSYPEVPPQAADFSVPVWIMVARAAAAEDSGAAESSSTPAPESSSPMPDKP